MRHKPKVVSYGLSLLTATAALIGANGPLQAQEKKPNIVMLMTDDTGWNDFGCYSGGGAGLGHPTPNVDRIAKEGAVFTCWYGSQPSKNRTEKNCFSNSRSTYENNLRPPTHCHPPRHHDSATRAGSVAVASRRRNACRLRAVADARRQRDSAAAVFPRAELYRAKTRSHLLRLEPLHDRLRLWSF